MPESPSATIRRAADALNLASVGAKTSATGRWHVRTPRGRYPQSIADDARTVLVADTFEGPQHPQTTAPYVASMDPPLGFTVASLLESVAADIDANLTELRGREVYVYGSPHPHPTWTGAYHLALTYLREAGGEAGAR